MALRRALPRAAILAAALFLVLPAAAMAAPQWLGAETRDAAGGAPDVTTDADGNSAAVWIGEGGEVNAAVRPRGGPWGPAENLEPQGLVETEDAPLVVAQPSGDFVAVWIGDFGGTLGDYVRWAHRPADGDWSEPASIAQATQGFLSLLALDVGAGGDMTVLWTQGDGLAPFTNTKPAGEPWGLLEPLNAGGDGMVLAVAPDGSSAVAYSSPSCDTTDCVLSVHRPPGGRWDAAEVVTPTTSDVTGVALAARPDSSYTVIWGEDAPNGRIASADRSSGAAGVWDENPTPIADLGATAGGCTNAANCLDLATRGPTLAAVWQQTGPGNGEIGASLRAGDGDWGDPETVGSSDGGGSRPQAAITAGGIAVAAWQSGTGATGAVVRGAHRSGPGSWDEEDLGNASVGEGSLALGDVVADDQGDAVTAWRDDPDGTRTAGFDGAGPRFTAFSLPSGSAGQSLPLSASAADNWSSLASISWLFGDGGGTFGGAVSHTYGAPGGYTATATATDTVGNAAQQSGAVPLAVAPTPAPDPCGTADTDKDGIKNGCDDNNGARRPVAFKTVNATVVSGEVFVKLPAGSASASQAKPPKGFKRLEGAETIPVGSTLDTARGRVKIRSAANTRRKTQTGQFFRGRFLIRQVRIKRRSKSLITDMRLAGSSFKKRCRATASVSQKRRKRSKKRVRRLFGDAKGTFRTSGRNAAATVRGTRWGVQDRCDGTLVAVQRGRVEVRDKVKRKTIILRRGKTYLARAR